MVIAKMIYPQKLCLVKYELDIHDFVSLSFVKLHLGVSVKVTCACIACKKQWRNAQK